MKKIILLMTIICLTSRMYSQEITVPEPDFEGQIFYVDNNTQIALEENMYHVKGGASVGRMITGVGKVKAIIVVNGSSSPIKLSKKEKTYFICNYNGNNNTLPSKVIECLKFDVHKKTREKTIASQSNVNGQSESGNIDLEKFIAKKYGKHSYLIEFTDLDLGEYGFSIGGEDSGKQVYMFSVVE